MCAFQNFYARRPPGSAGPRNVNLGPPNNPKSTRARLLKLKTQVDVVKYSLWVKKLQYAALDISAQSSYVRSYLCFFYLNKVIFAVLDVPSLPLQ